LLFGENRKVVSFCISREEFAIALLHTLSGHGNSPEGGAFAGNGSMAGAGVAMGLNATTLLNGNVIDAIQLGTGVNDEVNTFKVYNFKLLDSAGVIPTERLPPHLIELENNAGFIRWRYLGETDLQWRNLVDVTTLEGTAGENFIVNEYGDFDEAKIIEIEAAVATGRYLFLVNPLGDTRLDNTTPASLNGDMNRHILMYDGDTQDWFDYGEFTGLQGDPGEAVELRNNGTWVQWKYTTSPTWTNLIELTVLKGDQGIQGIAGLEVELQKTATHIQWRLTGEAWANLVALSDLTGPQGDDGADGVPVEFRVDSSWVQWKYTTDVAWNNLYLINQIPLTNLGTQNADFNVSLQISKMQEAILDAAAIEITFTNLQASNGTINVLTLTAAQEVALTWDANIKWAEGEKLETILNGETYMLHISTRGNTQAKITINYILIA
jgi:hypothetical protein